MSAAANQAERNVEETRWVWVEPFEGNVITPDQGLQLRIAETLERIASILEHIADAGIAVYQR